MEDYKKACQCMDKEFFEEILVTTGNYNDLYKKIKTYIDFEKTKIAQEIKK